MRRVLGFILEIVADFIYVFAVGCAVFTFLITRIFFPSLGTIGAGLIAGVLSIVIFVVGRRCEVWSRELDRS